MRKGGVILFVLAVVGVYSWADFGNPPVEVRLTRLYYLTPGVFCGLFACFFYEISELRKKIERLQSAD